MPAESSSTHQSHAALHRQSVRTFFAMVFFVWVTTGCATVPTQQDFEHGVSRHSNKTLAVVSRYPINEVPHTLMKKPVAEGKLTSGHGYRLSPTGAPVRKKHEGVDYSAPAGTPVYAAGDGIIVKLYRSRSYGNYIRVEHENDFYTAYAHMQAFVDGLAVGSVVRKGQMIGNVGSTGRSSGNHLHFELIHKNNFIDPLFVYNPGSEQTASQ